MEAPTDDHGEHELENVATGSTIALFLAILGLSVALVPGLHLPWYFKLLLVAASTVVGISLLALLSPFLHRLTHRISDPAARPVQVTVVSTAIVAVLVGLVSTGGGHRHHHVHASAMTPAPLRAGSTRRAAGPTAMTGWWPDRRPETCDAQLRCQGTRGNAIDRYDYAAARVLRYPTGIPDERAFLNFAATTPGGNLNDERHVARHTQLTLDAVINNAADPNQIGNAAATTNDLRISFLLPTRCGRVLHIIGLITHTEADVDWSEQLTDSATVTAPFPVCLRYVPSSGQLGNGSGTFPLSNALGQSYDPATFDRRELYQEGPDVGCRQIDGKLPGSFPCAGHVSAVVAVYRNGTRPNLTPRLRDPDAAILSAPTDHYAGLRIRVKNHVADVSLTPAANIQNGWLDLITGEDRGDEVPVAAQLGTDTYKVTTVRTVMHAHRFTEVGVAGPPEVGPPLHRGTVPYEVPIPHLKAGRTFHVRWQLTLVKAKVAFRVELRPPGGRWQHSLRMPAKNTLLDGRVVARNTGHSTFEAPSYRLEIFSGLQLVGTPVLHEPDATVTRFQAEPNPGRPPDWIGEGERLDPGARESTTFQIRVAANPAEITVPFASILASVSSGAYRTADGVKLFTPAGLRQTKH